MLPLTRYFILYSHQLPTTFIKGWKGIKDQVWLECKALISSYIASCQTAYLSASENIIGSEVGENITRDEAGITTMKAIKFVVLAAAVKEL